MPLFYDVIFSPSKRDRTQNMQSERPQVETGLMIDRFRSIFLKKEKVRLYINNQTNLSRPCPELSSPKPQHLDYWWISFLVPNDPISVAEHLQIWTMSFCNRIVEDRQDVEDFWRARRSRRLRLPWNWKSKCWFFLFFLHASWYYVFFHRDNVTVISILFIYQLGWELGSN